MARSPHKQAHPLCLHTSWSACDLAQKVRFGQCRKMVEAKREPHPCTRWAVSEDGWCEQHHVAEKERIAKEAIIKATQLQLDKRINVFLDWTHTHPSVWDRMPQRKPPHRRA